MHKAAYAGRRAELDQLPGGIDVYLAILGIGHAGPPVYCGQVINRVDAPNSLLDHGRVPNVPDYSVDPCLFQRGESLPSAYQAANVMARRGQAQRQRYTGEASGTGN
jgi:hypothetical protein